MSQINLIFENEQKTKTEHINFQLYDAPLVDRVCQLLSVTKDNSRMAERIDVRRRTDGVTTLQYAKELNSVIDEINDLDEDCQIPNEFLLDLTVPPHEQVEKLNRLHEIFQLYSEKYGTGINETQELLERVNILVHLMEAAPVEINQVFIVAKQSGVIPRAFDIELSAEDHMLRMPHALWGILEMDYATIGKDIGACYWTNDSDLIKRNEHRQQLTINPGVAANFMEGEHNKPTVELDQKKMQEFYDWCEQNRLGDFIDYKAPEYRLGRLRLGEITEKYTMDQILDLSLYYPNVREIEVLR